MDPGHHIGTIVAVNRREKAGRPGSLGVAGSLANKGFQDYSGLDTSAEADNSIPAASTKKPATSDCTALLDVALSKGFDPSDGRTGLHPAAPWGAPDECNVKGNAPSAPSR